MEIYLKILTVALLINALFTTVHLICIAIVAYSKDDSLFFGDVIKEISSIVITTMIAFIIARGYIL